MSIRFSYTPPTVNAVAAVQAAGEVAVRAAAESVLEESQRLVPVDTGALKASGRVSQDGLEAAVSYGSDDHAGRNGQDTAKYAVRQHEELDYHHEVGQSKYLETAMHQAASHVAETLASALREAM